MHNYTQQASLSVCFNCLVNNIQFMEYKVITNIKKYLHVQFNGIKHTNGPPGISQI